MFSARFSCVTVIFVKTELAVRDELSSGISARSCSRK